MKKFLLLFLLALCLESFGQNSTIDLNRYFSGKYSINAPYYQWRPSTTQYSFSENNGITIIDAKTNKTTHLTTNDVLKNISNNAKESISSYQWIDENTLYFPALNKTLNFKDNNEEIKSQIVDNVIDQSIKNQLFIIKENGLVWVKSKTNNPILLCPDTGKNIVFGESVHRSEWGIGEGQYISNSGRYIAFYRMDESMVEDYPLVNTGTSIATVEMMKYPMAGRTNHQVTVGIFDVEQSFTQNKTVYHYIKTEKEDGEFLTNITFSPDEKHLYITHLNRGQNHSKLIEYDILTGGKTKVILEETDTRYVEPSTRMIFLANNEFIWQSDRDGWNHLYLYNLEGKLIKQLTKGNYEVTEVYGIDSKQQYLYFLTPWNNPIDRYIFSLNLKTLEIKNLTPESGTHYATFSSNMEYFIDYFTNYETPRKIFLRSSNGNKNVLLHEAKNPYRQHEMGEMSFIKINNKAGDTLYARMIKPTQFDETKQYPCLIYVYGGPHSQMVTNTFNSGGVFLQYLAQKGYVIFTLDNRGTAHRGADFEKCIHRNLGVLEMEDQMCGVEYLKSLPYIDSTRLGLDGWSYGGFLILSLITTYPETFKAASCGGPVVDWKWYEIMYGERYMDTPEENPVGYAMANIIPKVHQIKCNLLVMHGAQDHTVVWQNSMELLKQAVIDNIQLDYFVYTIFDHNVRGKSRVHLWNKIERFHELNLK